MDIKIRKFDMRWITDDQVIVAIGKRKSGKSVLTKDLLYYHQNIPVGTVICPTNSAHGFYNDIIPQLFIHEEFSPELLANVMKRQKKIMKKVIENPDANIDPRAFLILDDCMYDKDIFKNKSVKSIFFNGRHYKLLLLITLQDPLGVSPALRANTDYVFIYREPKINMRKRLYEHYCGMFPTFDAFCQTLDVLTEGYGCMVIDNCCRSNKLEDQVFHYTASFHEDFRMGADIFWKHSEENYDEDADEEDEDNIDNYRKKKGLNLTVRKV